MVSAEDKGRYDAKTGLWVPPEKVLTAVEQFIDEATATAMMNDEPFTYCHMCDMYDSHVPGCPVAVLQAWQMEGVEL